MKHLKKQQKPFSPKNVYSITSKIGIIAFCCGQIFVLLDAFWKSLVPLRMGNLDSMLTTCMQIVVGLFGVTLTGYIFFAGQMNEQAASDDALKDVIELLKKRYRSFILLLTCFCSASFTFGGANLMFNLSWLPDRLHRLLMTETLLLMLMNVLMNLYFISDVADPNKFEKISAQHKAKVDGKSQVDAKQFLTDCESIQEILKQILYPSGRTMHLSHNTASRLLRGKMSFSLWNRLDTLMKYYSSVLFSNDLTVSADMCILAREVRTELEHRMYDAPD